MQEEYKILKIIQIIQYKINTIILNQSQNKSNNKIYIKTINIFSLTHVPPIFLVELNETNQLQ